MNKAMTNYENGRTMFDVLFDDFGRTMLGKNIVKNEMETSPAVDVRETEKSYIMEVDLPGYSENDIDISMKDRVLTLSCKKEKKEEKKEGGYLIKERNNFEFKRRFNFSDDIDETSVSAVFENGVLKTIKQLKLLLLALTNTFIIKARRSSYYSSTHLLSKR